MYFLKKAQKKKKTGGQNGKKVSNHVKACAFVFRRCVRVCLCGAHYAGQYPLPGSGWPTATMGISTQAVGQAAKAVEKGDEFADAGF